LPLSPITNVNGTFAAVLDQLNAEYDIGSPITRNQPNSKSDKYIDSLLKSLIDDVCIYYKKKEDIEEEYRTDPNENMEFELEHIPIRAVPVSFDPADPCYRTIRKVDIVNERGFNSGIFGWCFVCRGTANLYCKDTRVSICTLECKLKHLEDLGIIIDKSS